MLARAAILFLASATASAADYSTAFPSTENPISESGRWTSGTAAAWHVIRTTTNKAFGTQPGTEGNCSGVGDPACGDSTAVLTGTWGQNQDATGTVSITGTPLAYSEVEIRINTTITAGSPGSISGYECLCNVVPGGSYGMQIVRWNGPLGDFDIIGTSNGSICATGNTLHFWRSGSTIFCQRNSDTSISATDSTYLGGSPGIGHYAVSESVPSGHGFSAFTATDGLSSAPSAPTGLRIIGLTP